MKGLTKTRRAGRFPAATWRKVTRWCAGLGAFRWQTGCPSRSPLAHCVSLRRRHESGGSRGPHGGGASAGGSVTGGGAAVALGRGGPGRRSRNSASRAASLHVGRSLPVLQSSPFLRPPSSCRCSWCIPTCPAPPCQTGSSPSSPSSWHRPLASRPRFAGREQEGGVPIGRGGPGLGGREVTPGREGAWGASGPGVARVL